MIEVRNALAIVAISVVVLPRDVTPLFACRRHLSDNDLAYRNIHLSNTRRSRNYSSFTFNCPLYYMMFVYLQCMSGNLPGAALATMRWEPKHWRIRSRKRGRMSDTVAMLKAAEGQELHFISAILLFARATDTVCHIDVPIHLTFVSWTTLPDVLSNVGVGHFLDCPRVRLSAVSATLPPTPISITCFLMTLSR